MPDHIHPQKADPGPEDAGCGASAENHVPESGTVPDFPDVKLTFSFSGLLLLAYILTGSLWKQYAEAKLEQAPPSVPGYSIYVFNNQGEGLVVKKRSRADPSLMEDVEYDAEGKEISRSYEPA